MENLLSLLKPSLLIPLAIGFVCFVIDLITPIGWMVWLPYVGLMLVPLLWSDRPSPVLLASTFTAFIIISLVVDYFYIPLDVEPKYALFNRALGIMMLWLIAALMVRQQRIEREREHLIHQLQDAIANLKTLRGLLPFCLSCKKIREVDGYWSRIEAYVTKHSLAEFTPGLCPECEEYLSAQLPEEQSLARGQR
jgi:hypothetical protein